MTGHYEIVIGLDIYIVSNIIDNKAKIKWEKGESGLVFKKRLDGDFTLTRSGNEPCYDAIKAMTHCDTAYLRVADVTGTQFAAISVFNIRDIQYNDDICSLTIKPRYYDPYNIDVLIERDFNIINEAISTHTIRYKGSYAFEYVTYSYPDAVLFSSLIFDEDLQQWTSPTPKPSTMVFNGSLTDEEIQANGWTFYSQVGEHSGTPDMKFFYITTTWFREVKYVAKALDPNNDSPPPQGASAYEFQYLQTVEINNQDFNKYVRNVDDTVSKSTIGDYNANNLAHLEWSLSSYYGGGIDHTFTRARKLIDILDNFKTQFSCTTLVSQFFKSPVNPVSGADLTNLMMMQKSDGIVVGGIETSDPATLGIITFRQLMEQLWAMFQVTWLIQDSVLYIEHINYFRNNFSYTPNTNVGIDLTTYYPKCLEGSYSYSYEQNVPVREKFKFMESWNLDFVGVDIEYSNCITEGETITHVADLITTDIDPTYFDNKASKDGFVMYHCDSTNRVIETVGKLTNLAFSNGHLSWANLHQAYWRSNRPLTIGILNNEEIGFNAPHRKLKKQKQLEFPFCVENLDDVINDLVRTTMGDGEIELAEYTFKTGNVTLQLIYL